MRHFRGYPTMRSILLLFLSFLLPFNVCRLFAQETPPEHAAPSPSSIVGKPGDYSTEAYVFESLEHKYRFEADGKGQRESTFRVRIQSESAIREFGLLVYPYDSAFESLDVVYVRVRKPDGSLIETPATDIQELDSAVSREAPMYTDQREKHIAVKSLAVGDLVEVQLRWTVHDPIAPGFFWYDTSFFREGICLKQTVEISVPRDVAVKFAQLDAKPVVREEGAFRTYVYQNSNLKKNEEAKIPSWERDFHGHAPPELRFTAFSSWDAVGNWFSSIQNPKAAVTPDVRSKAEELTKGKITDDEKIRALYEFVSTRFRYIGVDLGVGRYSPHSASDVLSNRYGDCKDKHTLFQALLQAAGVQAYPALISSKFKIDPELPSPSLFDHLITAIPQGDSFLFLDTTPEVAPFGLLMATLRDRQALVILPGGRARLVNTPAEPLVPNTETARMVASIDTKGTLDAKMNIEETGDGEVALRAVYRATPQNNWTELTQKIAGGMGFGGSVSDVSVTPPEQIFKPFVLSFSYHRTDFPDWKSRRIVLPTPYFFFAVLTEDQKLSKDPLPLGALQDITYETTIKLPADFSAVLPDGVELKKEFGEFSARYSMEGAGTVRGILHLKTRSREIPATERIAFNDFSTTVRETPNRYIFINGDIPFDASSLLPPALAGRSSSPADRVQYFEQGLKANPTSVQIRSRLVQAYIANSQPEKAIAFLEETTSKSTKDFPGANLLFAKAYLALPDKEKAFGYYQKAADDNPDPNTLNTVAWDLEEAEIHTKEALNFARRAVAGIDLLTLTVSLDHVDASEFGLMLQLTAYWDTLGWIHFRMGDMPEAKKYLEAAWQLSQDPVIGEHLVELYAKLGETKKAVAICEMALAAFAAPSLKEKLTKEMETLRPAPKATTALDAIRNSSRGAMALSDIRTIPIPYHAALAGKSLSAEFAISIDNGSKADNVVFSSGAESLRNAIADIAGAKFPQSFPDETPTRVLRKGILSCSSYTKFCNLILLPIVSTSYPSSRPSVPTP